MISVKILQKKICAENRSGNLRSKICISIDFKVSYGYNKISLGNSSINQGVVLVSTGVVQLWKPLAAPDRLKTGTININAEDNLAIAA